VGSAFIAIVWLYVDSGRLDSPWSKDSIFQPPPFEKKTAPLGKSPTFFKPLFSWERNRKPTIRFKMDLEVLCIYRMTPRKFDFRELVVFFNITSINRSFLILFCE
jgi:hypothetical protein